MGGETRRKFDADFREGAVRLVRLRKENAELTMERDAPKRSVVLWVREVMGR